MVASPAPPEVMARKIFKRLTIDKQKLAGNRGLAALGDRIHDPNLWHLNRHSVARAFLVGLFAGFAFQIIPFQMVIAASFALIMRANMPIAISLVWLTNPITMPPILYLTLKVGMVFYPIEHQLDLKQLLNFEWTRSGLEAQLAAFIDLVSQVWQPLLIGSFIVGTLLGLTGYLTVQVFWRWHVRRDWNRRQHQRLQRRLQSNTPQA